MPVPEDRRYSREHEWALPEPDGLILVGITDFAQHELGDVVYVDLPRPGDRVTQNAQMGEVESVKAVSELFSPVSGEVAAVNEDVKNAPELLNESPHEKGWLIRVKPDDPAELDSLLDAAAYTALTE
ncbi:MAG: glycine cleavage system protein GcvH [Chloroflexota bacterium]|nr:glycine cleavage system protein GcvH [Chloroflexota bacterium]MDE2885857.1 glycine cleavage system protein GcvH [Chloroflexota bacterium]